jgi:hypothetical protein
MKISQILLFLLFALSFKSYGDCTSNSSKGTSLNQDTHLIHKNAFINLWDNSKLITASGENCPVNSSKFKSAWNIDDLKLDISSNILLYDNFCISEDKKTLIYYNNSEDKIELNMDSNILDNSNTIPKILHFKQTKSSNTQTISGGVFPYYEHESSKQLYIKECELISKKE